jgi:hypothetical protein
MNRTREKAWTRVKSGGENDASSSFFYLEQQELVNVDKQTTWAKAQHIILSIMVRPPRFGSLWHCHVMHNNVILEGIMMIATYVVPSHLI